MVFVRFLVLALFTIFTFGMGTIPANQANSIATISAAMFFVAAPLMYFLPTIEASIKKSPNITSIALTNLFLGWTLIGWVVAIAWAHKKPEGQPAPVGPSTSRPTAPQAAQDTKACPMCAETMLAAAIKCKHCGSAC